MKTACAAGFAALALSAGAATADVAPDPPGERRTDREEAIRRAGHLCDHESATRSVRDPEGLRLQRQGWSVRQVTCNNRRRYWVAIKVGCWPWDPRTPPIVRPLPPGDGLKTG